LSQMLINLSHLGETKTAKPDYILKAFKFTNVVIQASGVTEERTLLSYFRHSGDGRRWSQWEPLTRANITTAKIDILSLFHVEFMFTRGGSDNTGEITVDEVLFEGDFQNVTDGYKTHNRFGLRAGCLYADTACEGLGEDVWENTCEGSFKPYEADKSVNLYSKLANDVSNMFGWEVDYYLVEPDENAKDAVLHEYGLFNYTHKKKVKVLVPENKFPDNAVQFNQFDLSLFESFEIHITKEEFKRVFGIDRRPAEKDRLFFCQINRMYKVEHAQVFREFMNTGLYYKVVLTKHQDNQNMGGVEIDGVNELDSLNDLMENSSFESIFQEKVEEETKAVVNKEVLQNKSIENVRLDVYAPIIDHELMCGSNVVSRNYYDMSRHIDRVAVSYRKVDNTVGAGENRSFVAWVNIREYKPKQYYNFVSNMDSSGGGYKIGFRDGVIVVNWFGSEYLLDVGVNLNVWYGIVVNFDQRKHTLSYALYKRGADNTGLVLANEGVETLEPREWAGESILKVMGSPMYLTNLRVFTDTIPHERHHKVLNQYIVKDTSKLLIADNCHRKIVTPQHKF
jgi:hypothetical protein